MVTDPMHVSAGTWAWVRQMYGLAMHQTGAELDVELHLQIFDQALEIRDRKLLEAERDRLLDRLARLADQHGGITAAQLRACREVPRQAVGQSPPDESPFAPPPTAAG